MTNEGKMVASKAPRKARAVMRPLKFVAAAVQAVTIPQEI
jgi:hypothetical protein